ncbi:hypothetical protein KGF54_001177 [Candida jiufengensis]|uniref:uncharacterized protein n=1 Tax=Candida jiufengensis TaxID=497108 RepID=UPI0022257613|nr:uncharacterized protein KGF54_001177 [Candida jiufengensis]KAI5955675.1 hypothetical protein KGF54_001177 [Candida jiufengensis]
MSRYKDIQIKSRPVSIATTNTNVTSHDHQQQGSNLQPTQTLQSLPPTSSINESTKSTNKVKHPLHQRQQSSLHTIKKKDIKLSSKKEEEYKRQLKSPQVDSKHEFEEIEFLKLMYSKSDPNIEVEQLQKLLPILNLIPNLNWSIHIFLSTIMVKFINSWYLTKLNTNNFEFVEKVYNEVIVVFAQDLNIRITKLFEDEDQILNLEDVLIQILDEHLKEFVEKDDREYSYKVINDYYDKANNENNLHYDPNLKPHEILDQYLFEKHIIFDTTNEESQLLYFRVLVKKILQVAFKNLSNSIYDSKISSDLVILILSDLILNKLFEKLSSQEFIIGNIDKIVTSILQSMKDNKKTKKVSTVLNKLSGIVDGLYFTVCLSIRSRSNKFDFLQSSVFTLLNNLLFINLYKPMIYGSFLSIQTIISNFSILHNWFNNLLSNYILKHFKNLEVPTKLSQLIDNLRVQLFYEEKLDVKEEEEEAIEIDQITNNILQILNSLPIINQGIEDKEIVQKSIKSVLIIFAEDEEINQNNKINKYLIIKLLDFIVHTFYNEI